MHDNPLNRLLPDYEWLQKAVLEQAEKATPLKKPDLSGLAQEEIMDRIERVFQAGNTILFAGIYTYFNFCKMSMALRKKGYRTLFLCLNPSNLKYKSGYFDAAVDASGDIGLFYKILNMLPFLCVHFQAWLGLHCFAAAAALCSESRVVTEFNDIPMFILDEKEYDQVFEKGSYSLEKRSIEVILKNSDGLVFNTVPGGADELFIDTQAKAQPLYFNSYPLKSFFSDELLPGSTDTSSIVFTGTVNPSSYPDTVFGDVKLLNLIKVIVGQKIGFTIFLNPYQVKQANGLFQDYFDLEKDNPYFHIMDGVSPDFLSAAISSMGYGSLLYLFPDEFLIKEKHFNCMIPTKFFSYIEAGLPVLVMDRLKGVSREVEQNGLGVVLAEKDLYDLEGVLKGVDYQALKNNVLKYREKHSMDHEIDRLFQLYNIID